MSPLERLQLDIAARLDAAPELSGAFVAVIRPRSEEEAVLIRNGLNKRLGDLIGGDGKLGAALLVNMPTVDVPEPNSPGPSLRVTCTIQVIEKPLVNMGANGTGKSAEDLGLAVLQSLHQWNPGGPATLYAAEGGAMTPDESVTGKIIYNVQLRTRIPLERPLKAGKPIVTRDSSSNLVLTTSTGGAEIRYTLDGTLPVPASPLYVAPLPDPSPGILRAVAYAAGWHASDVAEPDLSTI